MYNKINIMYTLCIFFFSNWINYVLPSMVLQSLKINIGTVMFWFFVWSICLGLWVHVYWFNNAREYWLAFRPYKFSNIRMQVFVIFWMGLHCTDALRSVNLDRFNAWNARDKIPIARRTPVDTIFYVFFLQNVFL